MAENVAYQTKDIANFFARYRRRWDDFYLSERWVFERAAMGRKSLGAVLDVGCAVGGLGEALSSRFTIESYTGVDISKPAIDEARSSLCRFSVPAEFIAGDIYNCEELGSRTFDLVTALSVVDWNSNPSGTLASSWDRVAPGGRLLLSLRLSNEPTVCDIKRSYQYNWFHESEPPPGTEIAQYTVFSVRDALEMLGQQSPRPSNILSYGYWGKPSRSAHTPFQRLLFSVFLLAKPDNPDSSKEPSIEAHWPLNALAGAFGGLATQ